MLYTLNLDKDNYILSIAHTKFDNVELDIDKIDLEYLQAYKYENKTVTLDENKKAELKKAYEQETKNNEINLLKIQLAQSDDDLLSFIEDWFSLKNPLTFISDMFALMKNYTSIVTERRSIRARIKELGG